MAAPLCPQCGQATSPPTTARQRWVTFDASTGTQLTAVYDILCSNCQYIIGRGTASYSTAKPTMGTLTIPTPPSAVSDPLPAVVGPLVAGMPFSQGVVHANPHVFVCDPNTDSVVRAAVAAGRVSDRTLWRCIDCGRHWQFFLSVTDPKGHVIPSRWEVFEGI